jgi:hypothetical protein
MDVLDIDANQVDEYQAIQNIATAIMSADHNGNNLLSGLDLPTNLPDVFPLQREMN